MTSLFLLRDPSVRDNVDCHSELVTTIIFHFSSLDDPNIVTSRLRRCLTTREGEAIKLFKGIYKREKKDKKKGDPTGLSTKHIGLTDHKSVSKFEVKDGETWTGQRKRLNNSEPHN